MRLHLLVLAVLLAGCASSPAGTPQARDDGQWELAGSWTSGYTQSDIDAWCAIADDYDNPCVTLTSEPPQFRLGFTSERDCLEARERVLALSHISAGACLERPPVDWRLGGAWTSEYTQADIDAWCAIAKEYGNECVVMESFPPQFSLTFASEATCQEARGRIVALEHVTARECVRIVPSGDPDGSTSSPPQPSPDEWRLAGSFTPGYTQADLDAWCDVARESGNGCGLMKSDPPQFAMRFARMSDCDAARARIAAIPHTYSQECTDR